MAGLGRVLVSHLTTALFFNVFFTFAPRPPTARSSENKARIPIRRIRIAPSCPPIAHGRMLNCYAA